MLPDASRFRLGDVALQAAHDPVHDLVEHLFLFAQDQVALLLHRRELFDRGDQDAHAATVSPSG